MKKLQQFWTVKVKTAISETITFPHQNNELDCFL